MTAFSDWVTLMCNLKKKTNIVNCTLFLRPINIANTIKNNSQSPPTENEYI